MTALLSPDRIGLPPPIERDSGTWPADVRPPAPAARALPGPILVASGDPGSIDGALRIAELLARRYRVNAHVLGIAQPLPVTMPPLTDPDRTALAAGRRKQHLAAIRQHVHRTVGRPVHFSTGADMDRLGRAIARAVNERRSRLVLVGLEPHGAPRRAATEDAALQAIAAGGTPVLAVPVDAELLPRRALVAMDFSEASTRAARMALLTLAHGGSLTLAHVEADADLADPTGDGPSEIYAEGGSGPFRRFFAELRARRDVDLRTMVLHGDPTAALLELASGGGYDLVAAGSRANPAPGSHATGSVSAGLLRGATSAVLIAPPTGGRR